MIRWLSIIFIPYCHCRVFMNGTIWQQADIAHGDNTPVKILFLQLVCTCAAYFFATFACKFNIQLESFALPIILVGPLTLSGVFTVCHYRQTDPCLFSPSIPDYIFYKVKVTRNGCTQSCCTLSWASFSKIYAILSHSKLKTWLILMKIVLQIYILVVQNFRLQVSLLYFLLFAVPWYLSQTTQLGNFSGIYSLDYFNYLDWRTCLETKIKSSSLYRANVWNTLLLWSDVGYLHDTE